MSTSPTERRRVTRAFGAVLKIARKERGLSLEALGGDANLDRTYPSLLERGLRVPTLGVLFDIARVLDVESAQLVSDTMTRLRTEALP